SACLRRKDLSPSLRADARHNLELAQLRWLKVRSRLPQDPANPREPSEPEYPKTNAQKEFEYKEVDPSKNMKREKADDVPKPASMAKKLRSEGIPVVLPDEEFVQPLSPEQTLTE